MSGYHLYSMQIEEEIEFWLAYEWKPQCNIWTKQTEIWSNVMGRLSELSLVRTST